MRLLDYDILYDLMLKGNGPTKIAEITGYKLSTIKNVCRKIRQKYRLKSKQKPSNICEITGLFKTTMCDGRIGVKVIGHPKGNSSHYIFRSRYIIEQEIGRYLESWEEVHHKDEVVTNDSRDNLEVLTTSQHVLHHLAKRDTKLNYSDIEKLMREGLGYKRIAKQLGYNSNSTQCACKKIRIRTGIPLSTYQYDPSKGK